MPNEGPRQQKNESAELTHAERIELLRSDIEALEKKGTEPGTQYSERFQTRELEYDDKGRVVGRKVVEKTPGIQEQITDKESELREEEESKRAASATPFTFLRPAPREMLAPKQDRIIDTEDRIKEVTARLRPKPRSVVSETAQVNPTEQTPSTVVEFKRPQASKPEPADASLRNELAPPDGGSMRTIAPWGKRVMMAGLAFVGLGQLSTKSEAKSMYETLTEPSHFVPKRESLEKIPPLTAAAESVPSKFVIPRAVAEKGEGGEKLLAKLQETIKHYYSYPGMTPPPVAGYILSHGPELATALGLANPGHNSLQLKFRGDSALIYERDSIGIDENGNLVFYHGNKKIVLIKAAPSKKDGIEIVNVYQPSPARVLHAKAHHNPGLKIEQAKHRQAEGEDSKKTVEEVEALENPRGLPGLRSEESFREYIQRTQEGSPQKQAAAQPATPKTEARPTPPAAAPVEKSVSGPGIQSPEEFSRTYPAK